MTPQDSPTSTAAGERSSERLLREQLKRQRADKDHAGEPAQLTTAAQQAKAVADHAFGETAAPAREAPPTPADAEFDKKQTRERGPAALTPSSNADVTGWRAVGQVGRLDGEDSSMPAGGSWSGRSLTRVRRRARLLARDGGRVDREAARLLGREVVWRKGLGDDCEVAADEGPITYGHYARVSHLTVDTVFLTQRAIWVSLISNATGKYGSWRVRIPLEDVLFGARAGARGWVMVTRDRYADIERGLEPMMAFLYQPRDARSARLLSERFLQVLESRLGDVWRGTIPFPRGILGDQRARENELFRMAAPPGSPLDLAFQRSLVVFRAQARSETPPARASWVDYPPPATPTWEPVDSAYPANRGYPAWRARFDREQERRRRR